MYLNSWSTAIQCMIWIQNDTSQLSSQTQMQYPMFQKSISESKENILNSRKKRTVKNKHTVKWICILQHLGQAWVEDKNTYKRWRRQNTHIYLPVPRLEFSAKHIAKLEVQNIFARNISKKTHQNNTLTDPFVFRYVNTL